MKKYIYEINVKNKNTCFIIGPEGDFTEDENELAIKNNYKSISLGKNILRTETAGVFVAAAYKIINQNG